MEQSLAEGGDGEELVDTKFGGVHYKDKDLRSSPLCLKCNIWALVCWIYDAVKF